MDVRRNGCAISAFSCARCRFCAELHPEWFALLRAYSHIAVSWIDTGTARPAFALSKLAFSTIMLISWLAALRKPAPRPWLQIANRTFVIWLLFQVGLSFSGVAAVLQQVAGIPIAPFSLSGLHLLWNTDLRWLIMLFIALPLLQLALGEWACRLATRLGGERPERAPANEIQRVTL